MTRHNRGCCLRRIIGELAGYLHGWKAYFRVATALGIALPTRHFVEMGLPLLHT